MGGRGLRVEKGLRVEDFWSRSVLTRTIRVVLTRRPRARRGTQNKALAHKNNRGAHGLKASLNVSTEYRLTHHCLTQVPPGSVVVIFPSGSRLGVVRDLECSDDRLARARAECL